MMTKSEAIAIFGKPVRLAEALGVTPGAITHWPEQLSDACAQRVVGAAVLCGLAAKLPVGLVPASDKNN